MSREVDKLYRVTARLMYLMTQNDPAAIRRAVQPTIDALRLSRSGDGCRLKTIEVVDMALSFTFAMTVEFPVPATTMAAAVTQFQAMDHAVDGMATDSVEILSVELEECP